jgi:hypothetical protein
MARASKDDTMQQQLIDGHLDVHENKQTIEQLTKRYADLHKKKIQAETNLENAEKELARLKEKARSEYGTDDVDELKTKLAVMETENERKRSQYQQSLDKIEMELNAAEQKYSEVKDGKDA